MPIIGNNCLIMDCKNTNKTTTIAYSTNDSNVAMHVFMEDKSFEIQQNQLLLE